MRNLLAIAAVLLSAGVAAAQSNPMSYEAMAKAKKGAWAEYTMTMPGGCAANKMTVRFAVVEKDEREMSMETDSQTQMGRGDGSWRIAPRVDCKHGAAAAQARATRSPVASPT